MDKNLENFPITGEACSVVLSEGADPAEMWLLKDVETLSDGDAWILARLWKETRKKPIEISTKELCGALKTATQIICLDIASLKTPGKELYIDDGELIERHLI